MVEDDVLLELSLFFVNSVADVAGIAIFGLVLRMMGLLLVTLFFMPFQIPLPREGLEADSAS